MTPLDTRHLDSRPQDREAAMPYLMHYVNSQEPQEISEEDTKRMINADFKDETMRAEMMKRLVKGEKVFLKRGFVTWVGG